MNEIRRLKAKFGGGTFTIELKDGTKKQFVGEEVFPSLYMHQMGVLRAIYHQQEWPEPPEVLKAIAGAADREKAFSLVFSDEHALIPYEVEPLIRRGEFVPRVLVGSGVEEAS